MKKILKVFVAGCVGFTLTGCLTTHEERGTLVGGVVGGVIGNQFGHGSGRAAATIAGTLVGGLIGNQIGKSMDQESRRRAMEAEQEAIYYGESRRWRTRSYRGEVIPEPVYYQGSRVCRRYKSVIWIDGEPQKAYGKACRVNGSWRIVS